VQASCEALRLDEHVIRQGYCRFHTKSITKPAVQARCEPDAQRSRVLCIRVEPDHALARPSDRGKRGVGGVLRISK
jgi:hypothetical protein